MPVNNEASRKLPTAAILVFIATILLSSVEFMEVFPAFSLIAKSPLFPFLHESANMLVVGLVLFMAYKYLIRLGEIAMLIYFLVNITYSIRQFPEDQPEILRIFLAVLVMTMGIWLIYQLRNSEKVLKESGEQLKETNEDLEIAQQLAGIGNWKWTLATNEINWSRGLRLLNGWDMQKPPPPFAEMAPFYTPDSWARLSEVVTNTLESGEPYDIELDMVRTDGSIIQTHTRGEAGFDADGKIVDLHGTIQNITENRRAEEQINQLADMLRTIRSINQLITREKDSETLIRQSCALLMQRDYFVDVWIVLFDGKGNIVATCGKEAGEDIDAFRENLETGHYPECVLEVLSPGKEFVSYDRPGKIHHSCVMNGRHSDKDTFCSKLEYGGRLYGVIGVSGPPGTSLNIEERELFVELCKDISFALDSIRQDYERKQAEEARRISEENFRHSVDESPLGIRILTAEEKTIYVNRALLDMYGFKKTGEFDSTPNQEIYTPESYAEHRKRVEEMEKGESVPGSYEISIVRKDGQVRYLEVFRNDVVWNGITQFQELYRDITEVKTLQEQLIMQDRLVSIGQLVSGVAHELNNPLTSVIGFTDILLQRELPEEIRADLKIVYDEAKRTSVLVRNLLTFARQQPQEKQPISIIEPIQAVLLLRKHEQNTRGIKTHTRFDPNLPMVMSNSSQLQQVFFNIINNAEFAMVEANHKGNLTITAEKAGDSVRVSFTDDGPGITKDNIRRLFRPFFTTKELGKGTGLGLSICHGIISEHGGRIWAESKPGTGATFTIELPIYDKQPEGKNNK